MNYNGINFYSENLKDKTEKEFIEHEGHHGLTKEQLKEAYALMKPKPVNKIKEEKEEPNGDN